jgi:hypothetical protein
MMCLRALRPVCVRIAFVCVTKSPLPFTIFSPTSANALKCTVFVPTFFCMTTVRRTDQHNLRQAISDILERTYAIEYAMGLFYRKGTERELTRASEDFEIMRGAVDRLGVLIATANQDEEADAKVAEPVA